MTKKLDINNLKAECKEAVNNNGIFMDEKPIITFVRIGKVIGVSGLGDGEWIETISICENTLRFTATRAGYKEQLKILNIYTCFDKSKDAITDLLIESLREVRMRIYPKKVSGIIADARANTQMYMIFPDEDSIDNLKAYISDNVNTKYMTCPVYEIADLIFRNIKDDQRVFIMQNP